MFQCPLVFYFESFHGTFLLQERFCQPEITHAV
uniref:Uncharacterized protein n=1 Tax=Arundo donax TaxID=35708 RepID=A0A0A9AXU3_ARUDO